MRDAGANELKGCTRRGFGGVWGAYHPPNYREKQVPYAFPTSVILPFSYTLSQLDYVSLNFIVARSGLASRCGRQCR